MIRKAKVDDIAAIHKLVKEFAAKDLMLGLSFGDITERIRDFQLYINDDGKILGCVALHVVWEGLVEVRSLAVDESQQGTGLGRVLLEAAIEDARSIGATRAFTLTFVPKFFEKMGFSYIERSELPHKVWQDCTKCHLFPDCGETAMIFDL